MRVVTTVLPALCFLIATAFSEVTPPRPQTSVLLSGTVEDENRQPIAGVAVTLHSGNQTRRVSTNELGRFQFEAVAPEDYRLDFDKPDFFRLSDYAVSVTSTPVEITVTLNHEYEVRSQLDVVASPHEVDPQQTRHEDELVAHEIREDPVPSSHTLQNALPALPGIVQDNSGLLHVAGSRVEDTLYVLDGFEMNNPSSGLFDVRVNVDTVRGVDVVTGRYGPQFANAGSGILAIQTNPGDDHWRFGATNFLPAFSFQRGTHLGNWFPRWTLSGPVLKGRAWFSDGLSLQHDFALVRELAPGSDTSDDWSGDNLLRAQYNLTPSQSLQGNFLYNASTATRTGLGPFTPAATTTDLHSRRYFVSAKDQVLLHDGLLEFGIASDADRLNRLPQGSETYVLTPTGPEGNYFEHLVQNSHRWQGRSDLTLIGRHWHGSHDIQMGMDVEETRLDQTSDRHAVEVRGANATLVRQTSFSGNPKLAVSELQTGGYSQDSWQLRSFLILQSSLRIDRNDFTAKALMQPRFVLNWIPSADSTKFSLGWGFYKEPTYLSLIAQAHDQQRIDALGANSTPLVTSFSIAPSLRQPFFETTSAEWQQQWNVRTTSTIHVTERRQHNGLVYANVSRNPIDQQLQLVNTRRDEYRSVELSLRHALRNEGDLMIDYTYSRARSNKIFDYSLEDFLLTSQAGGPLSWDAPHRLISHGAVQTKLWKLLFSYFAEYHTGFSFSTVNSQYQLAGTPNGFRYRPYFNVNIGAEKRFPFYGYQWAIRLSVINATGHHNYNSVINNIDAPNFLTFAGGQHRAFTARLRFVGRK